MNYIIEENLNFYDILNSNLNNENTLNDDINIVDSSSNMCLITYMPLEDNYITLPCNHKFNYLPLYKEVKNQKKPTLKNFEITRLNKNEIKCPYCRNISDKLLPFIPYENVFSIHGINYPVKYCMNCSYSCNWKYQNGIKKGLLCESPAYKINNNCFCKYHHNLYNNKNKKNENKINWNDEYNIYLKKYKLSQLKDILKKNKLKVCGSKKILIIRLKENNINI